MRALAIALLAACGSGQNVSNSASPSQSAGDYPALRWVPDAPTYLVSAHTVRAGQRAAGDFFDSFGMVARVQAAEISRAGTKRLGFDPLGTEVGTKLGVDLDGGIAMFSEGLMPTIVIHLAAPAVTKAFFDQLRQAGLHPVAAQVEGVEVDSIVLGYDLGLSWAIDHDWLWFHVTWGDEHEAPNAWFVHPHHPTVPTWKQGFAWAAGLAHSAKPLVGFWNNHKILDAVIGLANDAGNAVACLRQLEVVDKIGFTIDADVDLHHAGGRLALELGPAAAKISAALLPPPPGFAGLATSAPLALQWNVDLGAVAGWLGACGKVLRIDPDDLTHMGIRAARGVLRSLDPDAKSGTGALAFDLSSRAFFQHELDDIPQRSLLERDHTFGSYKGHHLAVPFIVSLDYVLDDHIALAAMGDGILDQLVAGTVSETVPIFAVDVRPPAMAESTWQWLFAQLEGETAGRVLASYLVKWRDGHVSLSIDHDALVLDASGNRR
jgi:hypothetical protein